MEGLVNGKKVGESDIIIRIGSIAIHRCVERDGQHFAEVREYYRYKDDRMDGKEWCIVIGWLNYDKNHDEEPSFLSVGIRPFHLKQYDGEVKDFEDCMEYFYNNYERWASEDADIDDEDKLVNW